LIVFIKKWRHCPDVPPLNDTSYNLVKEGINGPKRVYTGTNY
jgi:hypothetical protein